MVVDKTIRACFENEVVVVTGGAGFIGSNLVAALAALGAKVISLDNYSTGSIDNHVLGVEYINADTGAINSVLDVSPKYLFHLGEYSRVEQSFSDFDYVWQSNVAGTFAVLDFCRRSGCKLVYAGSSTKFGDGGLGRSQSPYGWTKASNTELVVNLGHWFSLDYAVVYFYNVYGFREIKTGKYATLIALFAEKMRLKQNLTVVQPGNQQRNFTHVSDVVGGLLIVAAHGRGDDFGIGSPDKYSVLEVAELFGGVVEFLPQRRGNRMSADLISEKTMQFGWEPSAFAKLC